MNFKSLDKDKKIEAIRKFAKTKRGHKLEPILDRLVIWGVLALICAFVIGGMILFMDLSNWVWILAGVMLVYGLIFLIAQHKIRIKEYNHFLEAERENRKIYRKK